jgi:hypothetical protein
MSLNIKNPAVYEAAAKLAKRRKISMTEAVLQALRSELDRDNSQHERGALASELLKIGRRCAAHLAAPTSSAEHGDML